jgi:putative SOS response-associated peptidase YedK
MCGRFSLATPEHLLAELFRLLHTPPIAPRYNIAPSQPVAVVRTGPVGTRREMALCRWGLVPSWAKDPSSGGRLINVRSEGVESKPSFRGPLRTKRCLVPADGFYEWKRSGARKQPYRFRAKTGGPFAFAGLWEDWSAPDGSRIETCAILTTTPNADVAPVHDRMPVVLSPADHDRWLSREALVEELLGLLRPCPDGFLVSHPVGPQINDPRHEGPDCAEPVRDAGEPQGRLF